MPSYSIIENFEVHKNNRFLEIAESLKPELRHKEIKAAKEIMVGKDRQMRTVITEEYPIENLYAKSLKRDDTVFVDFGDHAVGYVTLELSKTGSHQDAPVYFYLKFGERLEEMTDKTADYDGWLSPWLDSGGVYSCGCTSDEGEAAKKIFFPLYGASCN